MHWLLPLVILSVPPTASIDLDAAHAVEIYRCDFTHQVWKDAVRPADVNYDTWPDDWTRRRDKHHPVFLKIGIVAGEIAQPRPVEDAPDEPRWLRVALDGGAAAVYAPAIEVSSHFAYCVETRFCTAQLRYDEVYCSLAFYDVENRLLEQYESERVRNVEAWRTIRVGPIAPKSDRVRRAILGLHVTPTDKADLTGVVGFDDVRLLRLPRVTFTANSPHHVYSDPQAIVLTCQASGVAEANSEFHLRVIDVDGKIIDETRHSLSGQPIAADHDVGYAGELAWSPKIPSPGYYRAEVEMRTGHGVAHRRSLTLAVVRETPLHSAQAPMARAFGWSLPPDDNPLPLETLASLVRLAGVQWVKLPVWSSANDAARGDRLAWFVDHVEQAGVTVVGVLDLPPPEDRAPFRDGGPLVIARVLTENDVWRASLAPVMTRLAPTIRWWQLGADHDTSFTGLSDLTPHIEAVRQDLARYRRNLQLGITWRWLDAAPENTGASGPWNFISYALKPNEPPLTSAELAQCLQSVASAPEQRWAAIQPLSRNDYDFPTRARDLVERMAAAKIGGAAVTFVPRPFDPDSGLMYADGAPSDLFLAWRTVARLLAGAEYLGTIEMPQKSRNFVFTCGDESVMVVWNDHPVRETLYLGERVRQIDLWDRVTVPASSDEGQTLEVGPVPTLITGVNTAIARCRMNFRVRDPRLTSVFGRTQRLEYQVQNPFDQNVTGRMVFHTPAAWDVPQREVTLHLAAGERHAAELPVTLLPTASSGPQRLEVDFEITADRVYRFRVWRTIDIGLEDVTMEAHARLDDEGRLVVEQRLVNRSSQPISFLCQLFAPGRPRIRRAVLDLAPGETTLFHYLPDGAELLGQPLLLRAEEIGGERVLNYRFEAG